MKNDLLITTMTLLAGSLLTTNASPNDDVTTAAKQLGAKANYSWKTTVVVPEGSRFRPGPMEGKTEKEGFTHLIMTFGENTTQVVLKGDKAAISTPDGGWDSLADLDNAEGPRRFFGWMIRGFKAPVAQASELVAATEAPANEGDAYSGELTADGAKTFLTFRPRSGADEGPTVANPKGSVKFWLKNGRLTKYEFKVLGTVTFNNNESGGGVTHHSSSSAEFFGGIGKLRKAHTDGAAPAYWAGLRHVGIWQRQTNAQGIGERTAGAVVRNPTSSQWRSSPLV